MENKQKQAIDMLNSTLQKIEQDLGLVFRVGLAMTQESETYGTVRASVQFIEVAPSGNDKRA